jgi:hypothetical protein
VLTGRLLFLNCDFGFLSEREEMNHWWVNEVGGIQTIWFLSQVFAMDPENGIADVGCDFRMQGLTPNNGI